MIASAPGTSSIMCKWFRCGDLWPFQAQISWTDLPECQIPLTYIYGTFSYSGCSEVELLISKKGWGCKHYINEDHNELKGHTSRKIFLWSYYSGELLLPCRLLHQEVSHLQQYQPSRWHTERKRELGLMFTLNRCLVLASTCVRPSVYSWVASKGSIHTTRRSCSMSPPRMLVCRIFVIFWKVQLYIAMIRLIDFKLTSSLSASSCRRGTVTGPSYSSCSSDTTLSPGKAFLMPLYITLRLQMLQSQSSPLNPYGWCCHTCGKACPRRWPGHLLPPTSFLYSVLPNQPCSWGVALVCQSKLFFLWDENMMKQGVSLPYLYNLFPSKNSHLDCCIHHLSYAHLGKTSLREAHILPDDNLFPLSEVFCVWGASEVENEGDNCGQGY